MEIALYSFSKEPNSTAVPQSPGTAVPGQLRESSSIQSPAVDFQNVPPDYNYAYIPKWSRYYFIENWTWDMGLWRAYMKVDVLASFRDSIGGSVQYVLRAASNFDGRIVDTSYPTIAENSAAVYTSWQALPWDLNGGCYIVGVKGDFTSFYVFSPSALSSFCEWLFSDDYADQYFPGWAEKFPQIKVELNPMQYISSITWYPFNFLGGGSSLSVGWASYPGGADRVPDNGLFEPASISFDIPRHPQSERGVYLNLAPYSRYQLFYPPWGMIALDSTVLCNCNSISCAIHVDLRTGAASLDVSADNGLLLSRLEAQLGVSCQFTQITAPGYGAMNALGAAMGVAGSVAAGNYLGAASGVLTAIGDVASSMIPAANSLGASGGVNGLTGRAGLQAQFLEITAEDLPHRGRPLCQRVPISTLSGYVLCANVEIDCAGTLSERDEITRYMEEGFIYA